MFSHILNNPQMKITKETNYVKAGVNVQDGDTVKLLSEGEWKEITTPDGKKKVLQFDMELANGDIKTYTMNNTTMDNLTTAYGDDSIKWNKPLRANIMKQFAFGKQSYVLILTPLDWKGSDSPDIPVVEENQSYEEEADNIK